MPKWVQSVKKLFSVKWSYQYVKLSELLKYAYSFMWF